MMWCTGSGMGWWMWLVRGAGSLAFWIAVLLVDRHLLPAGRAQQAPERCLLYTSRCV